MVPVNSLPEGLELSISIAQINSSGEWAEQKPFLQRIRILHRLVEFLAGWQFLYFASTARWLWWFRPLRLLPDGQHLECTGKPGPQCKYTRR